MKSVSQGGLLAFKEKLKTHNTERFPSAAAQTLGFANSLNAPTARRRS